MNLAIHNRPPRLALASFPSSFRLLGVVLLLNVALWSGNATKLVAAESAEQPPPVEAKLSPLGVRQQHVEQMMDDLDRTFKTLATTLEKAEPERAARLLKALDESKQLLIQQRMGKISLLLNEMRLDTATDHQKTIMSDIERLLEILLQDGKDSKDLELAAQLERYKRELERLLLDERIQRIESGKIANKEKTLADLARQIEQLKKIIEKQQSVNLQTEAARDRAGRPLSIAADAQQKVRSDTESLAKEIADSAPALPKNTNADDPDDKTTPKDGGKPIPDTAEKKPPSAGDGAPSSEGPSSPSGGKGSDEASPGKSSPSQSGQQSLGQAAAKQQTAETKLAEGKTKQAIGDQQQALQHLKEALAELEQEKQRIASLPKEHSQELARRQDATARRTAQLAGEMKPSPAGGANSADGKSGGSPDGKSGGSSANKPAPGQKNVQDAKQAMENASSDLQQDDPTNAAQKQEQAVRNLREAIKEIEKRLAQLREQMQLDMLARLETRFREILERQRKATAQTAEIETKRTAEGSLPRNDRLQLAKVAAEEKALAEAAHFALEIILEDGSSVVFPETVSQLVADLTHVTGLLEAQNTDFHTQFLQREIELTISELLDALKKSKQAKKSQAGGGEGGGQQKNEPLLPGSAELKLLRSSQLRVNRRTQSLADAPPTNATKEAAQKELVELARRQLQITEITERILKRQP